MLTALQFSQLVAAAWAGPAACHFATISHYVAPGGYTSTEYQVSYHPLVAAGQPIICYMRQAPCPFEAIAGAVQAFAEAQPAPSLLGAVVKAHAVHVLRTAAAQLAGQPSSQRPGFAYRCLRHRCVRLVHE
jgi:hypothetical protein